VVLDANSFTTFAKNGNQIYYNNGNVGIGTSTPTQKLHVDGNILTNGNITCSNINVIGDFVRLDTITSNTEQMVIENAGTGPALKVTQTGNNSVAEFYDKESGLAMIVANNGNIGIGTNVPLFPLHVNGFVKQSNIMFFANTANIAAGAFTAEVTAYTNVLVNIGNCYNGTTCRFTPTVAGYYRISASAELPSNGGTRGINLRKNATTISNGTLLSGTFSTCASGASTSQIIPTEAIVQMNGSNDYVSVWAVSSGPTFPTTTSPSFFTGSLLSLL
jgi:hypothetical protein